MPCFNNALAMMNKNTHSCTTELYTSVVVLPKESRQEHFLTITCIFIAALLKEPREVYLCDYFFYVYLLSLYIRYQNKHTSDYCLHIYDYTAQGAEASLLFKTIIGVFIAALPKERVIGFSLRLGSTLLRY